MAKSVLDKISQRLKRDSFKYSLDQANRYQIVGWVFDSKRSSDHLQVQLRVGDRVVATVTADEFRQDLLDADIGSGHCGFHFDMQTLAAGLPEACFDLYANGRKLNRETVAIKMEVQTLSQQTATLEHYKVQVDNNIPGKILGWAIDDSRLSHKPYIECKMGGLTLGACVADIFRDDLAKAGIGDGKHAFRIDYDVALLPDGGAGLKWIVDGAVLADSEKSSILSSTYTQKAKDHKQQAIFVARVKQEMSEITQQVSQRNMNEGLPAGSVAGGCSVFVERMAEMSCKLKIIEKTPIDKLASN